MGVYVASILIPSYGDRSVSIHPSVHIRLLNDDETHLSLPFSRLRRSDIDLDLICLPSVTLGAYYGTSTLLYAAFAAHRRLHSLTPTVL